MKKLKNDKLKPLNENDIRPKNLMKQQKKAMNADIEWLKNRSKDFINVECPSCGSNNSKPLYKKYHLHHLICLQAYHLLLRQEHSIETLHPTVFRLYLTCFSKRYCSCQTSI